MKKDTGYNYLISFCFIGTPAGFEPAAYGFEVRVPIPPDFRISGKNAQWWQLIKPASVNPILPLKNPIVNRLWTLPLFVSLFLSPFSIHTTLNYKCLGFSRMPWEYAGIITLQSSSIGLDHAGTNDLKRMPGGGCRSAGWRLLSRCWPGKYIGWYTQTFPYFF